MPGMGGVFNSLNLGLYTYGHQNPLKYVDPNGEYITVKVQGTNVEIKITAQVTGPKATEATAQQFKTSTEKEFSGRFGKYNVKTTVDVQLEGKTDPSRHQIIMTDEKTASSAQVGGSKATMRLGGKPASQMSKEVPHEAGHLLGLLDEYKEGKDPATGARVTAPLPGKEDSLMATIKPDAKISEEHVGTIIQKSQSGDLNKGLSKPTE